MRGHHSRATSPVVPLVAIGGGVVAVLAVVTMVTLVAIYAPGRVPEIPSARDADAPGASLIAYSNRTLTVLKTLNALTGLEWADDGDTLRVQPVGYVSDMARIGIFSSFNVFTLSYGDAEYHYSELYSDAGTLMFHVKYHLFFSATANASGFVDVVFTMPTAFSSPPTADGATTLNNFGRFSAACTGNNNADGLPLSIFGSMRTVPVGFIGNTDPVMYIRISRTLHTPGAGFSVLCDADFMAPVSI